MGSTTTQDRPTTRAHAAGRVAFRYLDSVGALISDFRSSIPSPSFPLFTLRWTFRNVQCKTRGRADCYSFLVRLLHPHFHAGLSRRTQEPVLSRRAVDRVPVRRGPDIRVSFSRQAWQAADLEPRRLSRVGAMDRRCSFGSMRRQKSSLWLRLIRSAEILSMRISHARGLQKPVHTLSTTRAYDPAPDGKHVVTLMPAETAETPWVIC